MKVTVVGIELKDDGVVYVTLKGKGGTNYTNVAFLYLPKSGDIPKFGDEFELVRLPAQTTDTNIPVDKPIAKGLVPVEVSAQR